MVRSFACLALIVTVVSLGSPCARAADAPLYLFDMTYLHRLDRSDPVQARRAWDTTHLVSSVQGIVNRDGPRLFVRFMPDPDDFWWEHLRSDGEWLAGRGVRRLSSLEELLRTFDADLRGVVAYDERVWATSNLASTIAGVEDRACLRIDERPGSIYSQVLALGLACGSNVLRLTADDGGPLFTGRGQIPGADRPSTGSAKCDAYLWAKARYLDSGRCSPRYLANYIDAYWLEHPTASGLTNATLTNHDFFISQRAFFFDLHVWEEETPVDDRDQQPGTDLRTLRQLLTSAAHQADNAILHIGGFTPWVWKYTNHGIAGGQHGGVDTEWKYAKEISAFNGIMDADALGYSGMANASFYQHHPLDERYPQNPRPTRDDLRARCLVNADGSVAPKAFVCFYMGDYDSAAWLNLHLPKWWRDKAHGTTLCTWAFNPNLDRRAPHALHFARKYQTANDWFMFGDSGAGYLNPGMLLAENRHSGLPDGLGTWVDHCTIYANRYDLSITGFIIDGHSPAMGQRGMDAYSRFSPDGIVGQKIGRRGVYEGIMPYVRMKLDLRGQPPEAGRTLASMAGINGPKFLFVRTILKSPSWHRDVMAEARRRAPGIEFVDPYTFFALVRQNERFPPRLSLDGATQSVNFASPDRVAGLTPIRVADGPYSFAKTHGIPTLHQPKSMQVQYVYFEVADAFAAPFRQEPDLGHHAVVALEVLDNGPGRILIQYDARDGAYRGTPPQSLSGTHDWVTLQFVLKSPRFEHGQNGGADFRIVNYTRDLHIRRLTVKRTN